MSALPPDFTHLHVHSHYSLLRATAAPEELAARAVRDGLGALALTDDNALFGAVAFARACRAEGIRPIIGMTAHMAAPPEDLPPDAFGATGRLVLLAADHDGYRALCRLSSLYQSDPDSERRTRGGVRWEELRDNLTGLFCLTGGRDCWLERYLRAGQMQAAARYVARLGGLFGDRLALAVSSDVMREGSSGPTSAILDLAGRFGVRAAAVQPIFTLTPGERPLLQLLAAIAANCAVPDVSPGLMPDLADRHVTLHWPEPEQTAAAFAGCPELLAGASEIGAACGEALPDGRRLWPVVAWSEGVTSSDALRTAADAGLAARYGISPDPAVTKRLRHELDAVSSFGYAPLFLIVADLVHFARTQDIPVSTRGSVANSLLAYCLGITTVDPIAHDLLFERFLSPARAGTPDIDLDLCSRRRDEVLDYVRRKYGADRVALVSTMNTFQPRSAVREVGKAHGLSETAINDLVGRLPRGWHPDPRRRSSETVEDVIAALDDSRQREVIRLAYRLVGQPSHAGLHPGGIVITPGPLTDTVPVFLSAKGFLTTQFEHEDVEAVGLPKIDLLGIRALTVLADAAELVRHRIPDFRLDDIPLEDAATGDLLERGDSIGVFQCESDGARRTLRQLRARSVSDLAVAGAFFKPGPATGGMARAFIRRYRGDEPVSYLHPSLEPILVRTKGVLLFQEQVLRVARDIAGLSWEQAETLRRGISKFRADEMATLAEAFVSGCRRPPPDGPGLTEEQARHLWEQVHAFAGYGFNQGHATAYADVSYRSAYMKAHWPAEFLCARLADAGGFHHPAVYIAEARRLGIPVRPPHVNYSGMVFTVADEPGPDDTTQPVLWMGLGQVRDLRQASVRAIIAGAPYSSLADLLHRVPLSAKEAVNLISCGALDGLGPSRAAQLADAGLTQHGGSAHQMHFSFLPAAPDTESAAERVAWETRILGLPISIHPVALAVRAKDAMTLSQLPASGGRLITTYAARLSGWPGGSGFFVSDEDNFVIARLDRSLESVKAQPYWQPLRLEGRWIVDEWGGGWLRVEAIESLTI